MALSVRDLMTPSPHTIGVRLSLADAAKMMKKYEIRHLPVLEAGALVGVLSDRDVQMISSMSELDPSCILVEDAMSPPWTVTPETPLQEVAQSMADKKLGSAVVLENDKVIGVFTTTDGMRCLAELLAEGKPAKKKN
ncbi:MAG: CBS domain-containing protein [Myxococcota bacterium]